MKEKTRFFVLFCYLLSFNDSENDGVVTSWLRSDPPVTKVVNRNHVINEE